MPMDHFTLIQAEVLRLEAEIVRRDEEIRRAWNAPGRDGQPHPEAEPGPGIIANPHADHLEYGAFGDVFLDSTGSSNN